MDEIFGDTQKQRDPDRRWLRHTYQEGPGFRFLAARGGRPPGAPSTRRDLATVRARGRLLREGCDGADPILALLCQELAPRWNAAVHGGQGAPGRTTRS